jgi:hypothetical protein
MIFLKIVNKILKLTDPESNSVLSYSITTTYAFVIPAKAGIH